MIDFQQVNIKTWSPPKQLRKLKVVRKRTPTLSSTVKTKLKAENREYLKLIGLLK